MSFGRLKGAKPPEYFLRAVLPQLKERWEAWRRWKREREQAEEDFRLALERDLNSDDPKDVIEALLDLSLTDTDRFRAQHRCLSYCDHSEAGIRGIAVLCLGHIARLHRAIDLAAVVPVVLRLRSDSDAFVRGHAYSAAGDIKLFVLNDRSDEDDIRSLVERLPPETQAEG